MGVTRLLVEQVDCQGEQFFGTLRHRASSHEQDVHPHTKCLLYKMDRALKSHWICPLGFQSSKWIPPHPCRRILVPVVVKSTELQSFHQMLYHLESFYPLL